MIQPAEIVVSIGLRLVQANYFFIFLDCFIGVACLFFKPRFFVKLWCTIGTFLGNGSGRESQNHEANENSTSQGTLHVPTRPYQANILHGR